MKKTVVTALVFASVAAGLMAQGSQDAKERTKSSPASASDVHLFLARGVARQERLVAANLTYHGGPVITSAHVVFIFWGPSFGVAGADHTYATTLQSFRNQFGTTGQYNVITQYSGISLSNLGDGTADMFDTSTPPTNVTDTAVRSEVTRYLASHAFDASAIYEVVIPSTSYSSISGGGTSCGGPNQTYCAYHSNFTSSGDVKYSLQPWPSCSGCKVSGWSNVQNVEHFVGAETRKAVTDPDLNAWYDSSDNEADDKCAWLPTPFLAGGYGYQYEWSNAVSACVQTR